MGQIIESATPVHADIIQWAQQMRNFVREELADIAEKIEHADALVALEDAGGNAQDDDADADEDGGDAAPDAAAAASADAADTELWVQCTNCQKCASPANLTIAEHDGCKAFELLPLSEMLATQNRSSAFIIGHKRVHARVMEPP